MEGKIHSIETFGSVDGPGVGSHRIIVGLGLKCGSRRYDGRHYS